MVNEQVRSASLFDLEPTDDPLAWRLNLSPGLCAGSTSQPFLFGGVGLAAAVSAMEQSGGKPARWVTAQYVAYARPPAVIDIVVTLPAVGKQVSQANATLSIDGRTIVAAVGALGERASAIADQWLVCPPVPEPSSCPAVRHRGGFGPGMESRMDLRLAKGRYPSAEAIFDGRGDGELLLWVRPREGQPVSTQLLSVIADYMSVVCSHAVGRYVTGNSLDNTIRFLRLEPSDWVLCQIRAIGAAVGVTVVEMALFSQGQTLMAQASTSLITRE